MGFEYILVERSGDFATITMNRPQRRNALSLDHMRELIQAFSEVGESSALGIVLAGNGPVFSAGHDFADVADYADDAVFITPAGVKRGKEGVREGFTQLLADVPNADWTVPTQVYDGDVLFIEWTAKSAATKVEDGVDTFIFRDGQIRLQTVRYTLQHTS